MRAAICALIVACFIATAGASQANAAPAWELEFEAPTRIAPGERFLYHVRARNIGDQSADADASIEISLPDGVSALQTLISDWACSDLNAQEIHCAIGFPVEPRDQVKGGIEAQMSPDASGAPRTEVRISGGGAAPVSAERTIELSSDPDFGLEQWSGHIPPNEEGKLQAGSHPESLITTFRLNTFSEVIEGDPFILPDAGSLRSFFIDTPAGFLGSAASVPTCEQGDLKPSNYEPFPGAGGVGRFPACPIDSVIGTVAFSFAGIGSANPGIVPVFNMKAPPGFPAAFGFNYESFAIQITADAATEDGLRVRIASIDANQALTTFAAKVTFWGVPGDPSHDFQRCRWFGPLALGGGKDHCGPVFGVPGTGAPGDPLTGPNPAGVQPKPFLTLPTSCSEPGRGLRFDLRVESWEVPASSDEAFFETTKDPEGGGTLLGTTGCNRVPFQPKVEVQPTTGEAETPTGLEVALSIPPDGVNNPKGISQSHLKDATVTLPEGMTVNPSQANGLAVCSAAEVGLVSGSSKEIRFDASEPSCPDASQLGEVRIDTPVLREPLTGSIHIASPDDPSTPGAENPFDSTLALYVVAEGAGALVKLAAEVSADPRTGRIVTRFLNNPQQPFERFALRLKGGQRAPLSMPPTCGTFTTTAQLSPWARPNDPVTVTDSFQITKGPNGGPCPKEGVPPFNPAFSAGSANNDAGSFSPFLMRLMRADGEQDMTKLSATLPKGAAAKIAGVGRCSEASIAMAESKTARQEIASPSCPANSQIGSIEAGAGVGSIQTYIPGRIYLAGPFGGAPLSAVAIVPALAGPFDVGTIATRQALSLDPRTAQVHLDGERSEPIPHILKGIPLRVRDIRVSVDRPEFTLNPTRCDPFEVKGILWGSFLDVLDPADDAPVDLSDRYQAASCSDLAFKPKLDLKLAGGVKRGDHPALRATLKARPGDANLGSLSVTLPRSAFLDQSHIRTICTRAQFAQDSCPKAARYGYVKAFTPLLDEPLQGPVYLRSSNTKLPDLVFDLNGAVQIEVAARIDAVKGGIRATVKSVPDAPLTKVFLSMQGGRKGLIVNSANLCRGVSRADARLVGQNGKRREFRPVVGAVGCGGSGKTNGR